MFLLDFESLFRRGHIQTHSNFMLIYFVCVYVCTWDCFHGTCVAVGRQLLGARFLRLSSDFIRSGGKAFPAEPFPSRTLSDSLSVYICILTSVARSHCPPSSARLQQVSLLLSSLLSLRSTDLTRVTWWEGQRVGIDTTGKNTLFVVVYFLYSYFKAFGIYPDVWCKVKINLNFVSFGTLVTPTRLTEDPIFPLIWGAAWSTHRRPRIMGIPSGPLFCFIGLNCCILPPRSGFLYPVVCIALPIVQFIFFSKQKFPW